MSEWLTYPWARTEVGRKGHCAFCGGNVDGQPIVAALWGENWSHELCALRAFVKYLQSDISDVSQHKGTQAQFLNAVKANAVPSVTWEYARRDTERFTWTEKK